MAKPLEKHFDTCPMLSRSDWGVGHIQQKGLTHALSIGQSSVGFHGPRISGWLIFLNGCHRGEDIRLPVGETKVGSSWLSDTVLTGIGIGSQHAIIRMGMGEGTIAPISSDRVVKVNNIVINGQTSLEDGCLVTFGELHCIFRLSDQMTRGYQSKESPKPAQMPTQSSHRETLCGWLVISKGAMLGQDFRLVNGICRIGSESGLEVTVADVNLPKHALTLSVNTKDCKITFIASGITVFVNGQGATVNSVLRESDSITIDQVEAYVKWLLP
jgi:hypothetical protein